MAARWQQGAHLIKTIQPNMRKNTRDIQQPCQLKLTDDQELRIT